MQTLGAEHRSYLTLQGKGAGEVTVGNKTEPPLLHWQQIHSAHGHKGPESACLPKGSITATEHIWVCEYTKPLRYVRNSSES